METTVKDFLENPTIEEFQTFNKNVLLAISSQLELEVKKPITKLKLKNAIENYFIEEEIWEKSQISDPNLAAKQLEVQLELKRLEQQEKEKEREFERQERERERELEREKLKQQEKERELEREKFERQEREKEREREMQLREREKEREMQLREREKEREFEMKKLEMQLREKAKELELEQIKIQSQEHIEKDKLNFFDVTKHIRFVPPFTENEVDKFFLLFEKVAKDLNWPDDKHTILLQSVLKGKARDVYTALSADQCSDYKIVKEQILKAYELVPEAYRQKFRSYRKPFDVTHVEFAREKERLFDRWTTSEKVEKKYDNLKQIILLEEFKNNVHPAIRNYLDEHKVRDLSRAAEMADEFVLSRKHMFQNSGEKKFHKSSAHAPPKFSPTQKSNSHPPRSTAPLKSQRDSVAVSQAHTSPNFDSRISCAYCKEPGHIISDCVQLKEKKERERRKFNSKPVSFVKKRPRFVKPVRKPDPVQPGFEPFLSKGVISTIDGSASVPIDILRDTGATQTLLLANTLPFEKSDESVLIEGIEGGTLNIPLHKVNLSSGLVAGPVTVGVTGSLPVKGVHLLLGNDLAGGKVSVNPIMTDNPVLNDVVSPIEEEIPDLFPACAVTRAMTRRAEEKKAKAELDSDPLHGLHGTFLQEAFSPDFCERPFDISSCPDSSFTTSNSSGAFDNSRAAAHVSEENVFQADLDSDLSHGFDNSSDPRGSHVTHSNVDSDVSSSFAQDGDIFTDSADCRSVRVDGKVVEPVNSSEGIAPSFSDSSVSRSSTSGRTFVGHEFRSEISLRDKLSSEQRRDSSLSCLFSKVVPLSEIDNHPVCYYLRDGVLMRKWRPPDVEADADWAVKYQVVLPTSYRAEALNLAHDQPMAGHLGVTKTYHKLLNEFFWPGIKKDTSLHCKSCHTCQMVGKPNQKVSPAPLHPIPAFEEPFSRVLIDCVGPLPKSKSGNEYLLTIMCSSTRFPEAIPLRNIKAKTIVKALVKFFSLFGLPKSIQSDQGSNFMSNIFQQVLYELNIDQYKSSAYHPESQGALERFHQTLKTMIRTYCFENKKDWDDGIHWLLFAARESVQESLGFSPFDLVFGHTVRGPLRVMREKLLSENCSVQMNLLDYVSDFKLKLNKACEMARKNLRQSQEKMKQRFDKKSVERNFHVGDKVLALLPVQGNSLQARYFGPYEIVKKVNDVNYVISTPDRRKGQQLCHINMLKMYVDRETVKCVNVVSSVPQQSVNTFCEPESSVNSTDTSSSTDSLPDIDDVSTSGRLNNSDVLNNLDSKLEHLSNEERCKLKDLILEYKHLFPDVPTRTDKIFHDVDVGNAKPIKQHPYRLNPEKEKYLREEIQYLLDNDLIEPSQSEWASPCILVPKPDGSYRFCTDYRKVNSVTKSDSFPLPRIEDCIDKIGNARYVTKFDLLKGFWQIPLTDRAKEISAFITPDGLYQYKVAPFGMKNCPATFQRLMNRLVVGIEGIKAYLDDVIVFCDDFDDHLDIIRKFFDRLTEFHLTVNLIKSEFCQGTLTYLGHVVGQGQVKPVSAKVQAIIDFPVPESKKQLMRFLGMAGYYRKFCHNFSTVSAPLTSLLKRNRKFVWSPDCQNAFEKLKAMLQNAPVLSAPDFNKPFKLAVDASDLGAGAVLFQADCNDIDHPVSFYSKKFNQHQRNYSTVEKECLALILALQHFEIYVISSMPLEVFTDHNPLTFLSKIKNKNQRLLRWSLLLQNFNLDIKHIKGKDNVVADALSRTG